MSDYGFKIALPGYDVESATPEQCAVHSSYPPLKAKLNQSPPHVATLLVDFTAVVVQNTVLTVYAIDHGYSYVPASLSSLSFIDQMGNQINGVGSVSVGANLSIVAGTNGTQFTVTVYDSFNYTGANASLSVSYYIFAENGA